MDVEIDIKHFPLHPIYINYAADEDRNIIN